MATKKDKVITFSIYRIETQQYAVLREEIESEKLSFQAGFSFGVDGEAGFVRSTFVYVFLSDNEPALKLEVAIEFKIENECFKSEIDKEKHWVIPKVFATHLAMVVVGAARGILHEKTRGLELNKFPMPAINVVGTLKDDIIIEKAK